jgi:hypothetical protein
MRILALVDVLVPDGDAGGLHDPRRYANLRGRDARLSARVRLTVEAIVG